MLLLIFIMFSLPLTMFAIWFGWKAHQAGKPHAVRAMAWLAAISLLTSLAFGFWLYAVWMRVQ